jgi:APA family basic amino acid/polyamine antiporter
MEAEPRAPRLLAFDIGCIVVGGIIGVGIFFTPAQVAREVDSAGQVIAAWSLGGLLAMLGALVFAGLARLVPDYGGTFAYIDRAFGPFPAFLYGWANCFVIQAGALGVVGLVMAQHLDHVLFGRSQGSEGAHVATAVLAIALFTTVNYFGLRVGSRVQNLLTVLKTAAVFALVLLALFTRGGSAPEPPPQEARNLFGVLAGAMLPVMFAFGGWQQGSFVAGAARNPQRDVPLGIVGGVLVVVLAYVTVNLAFLDLLGFEAAGRSNAIAVDATRAALEGSVAGDVAARILGAAIVISALGIMNTICLAPPYVLHAMGKRGLFLTSAANLHARYGSPTVAVLVQGGAGIALVLATHWFFAGESDLAFLVNGVVFVDWLFFSLCGIAWLRLRERAVKLLWMDIVALLFTAMGLWTAVGAIVAAPGPAQVGLAACAIGASVYLLRRRPAP